MTEVYYYDTALLCTAPVSAWLANKCGMSIAGCPYRGTLLCFDCPLAPRIAAICDYRCTSSKWHTDCEHRAYCTCGHDQTVRLQAWGMV